MIKYKQQIVDNNIGDCFRACVATVFQIPPEVLPNDHSAAWHSIWASFFNQFGIDMVYGSRKDAIWMGGFWIASVKSINFEGGSHAIVMRGSEVYHDPSTKSKYRTGKQMLGDDAVTGGYRFFIDDATLLSRLDDYRKKVTNQ